MAYMINSPWSGIAFLRLTPVLGSPRDEYVIVLRVRLSTRGWLIRGVPTLWKELSNKARKRCSTMAAGVSPARWSAISISADGSSATVFDPVGQKDASSIRGDDFKRHLPLLVARFAV
jgi:hypothetical protein